MEYCDHQEIMLGDTIELDMPNGRERARVVMLGGTYEHLPLEGSFELWVKKKKILKRDSIVIEWLGENPLAHNEPNYAPVGDYMFVAIHEDIILIERFSLG